MSDCCAVSKGAEQSLACGADQTPLDWFEHMIDNCLEYAQDAQVSGHPIVGIMCEFTPRELILAAGALPVCLCGGSAAMVEPAERDLPTNLCPLIKSTYGYHVKRENPFLEMASLIVAETTCDGKKKMFELMAQTRPMHVLALPQKQDDAGAAEAWYGEMRRLKEALETCFHVEITPCALREAIGVMNRERRLRRDLAGLMRQENPPLTGRQLLQFKSTISGIPADLAMYKQALDELRKSTARDCLSSRVRVLLTGVPLPHEAERVLELIEDNGGLVVCQENCTGLKPILDDVPEDAPDPLRTLADYYAHLPCSVMMQNERRLQALRKLAPEYRVDCIIELVWHACLTYDVESTRVRRLAKELNLPYLRLQTDYSPADSARLAARIQALFEMTRDNAQAGHTQ